MKGRGGREEGEEGRKGRKGGRGGREKEGWRGGIREIVYIYRRREIVAHPAVVRQGFPLQCEPPSLPASHIVWVSLLQVTNLVIALHKEYHLSDLVKVVSLIGR